jgi:hypothetical protein
MKNRLFSMAAAIMVLTACNDKKADGHGHEHNDGAHQHADGETHADHTDATATQEEFTVSKDTTVSNDSHSHQHNGGEHEH